MANMPDEEIDKIIEEIKDYKKRDFKSYRKIEYYIIRRIRTFNKTKVTFGKQPKKKVPTKE